MIGEESLDKFWGLRVLQASVSKCTEAKQRGQPVGRGAIYYRKVDGFRHRYLFALGLFVVVGVKVDDVLVEAEVELVDGEGLAELVLLGGDVEGLAAGLGEDGEGVGAHAGDDAAVGGDGLGADEDLVDGAHGVGEGGEGDGGDLDALGAQRGDDAGALGLERRVDGVEDPEPPRRVHIPAVVVRGGGAPQQVADDARAAHGQDHRVVVQVLAAVDGDALAGVLGARGEEAAVAEQVLADDLEALVGVVDGRGGVLAGAVGAGPRRRSCCRLLKRHDQVLAEEVGAVAEGDGVADGGLQLLGLRLDEINSLVDGLDLRVAQELDQGFDGRHGHGQVRVLFEQAVVGRDDAAGGQERLFVSQD